MGLSPRVNSSLCGHTRAGCDPCSSVCPPCATPPTPQINNMLALVNTKLLRDYASLDPRLRQLVFVVKHWAKRRGVNDAYRWAARKQM